jgi:tripartite-type tricarboxylate transporter receptor subunit TctC
MPTLQVLRPEHAVLHFATLSLAEVVANVRPDVRGLAFAVRLQQHREDSMQASICTGLAGAILAVCAVAQPAQADQVADFYKGKQMDIVVGHEAGTGFDVYARVLQRHLGKHIPGNPTIVVKNMVGASGIVAANWMGNIAPKDGTVMATMVYSVAFERLFGNDKAQYDPLKFSWIGNMEQSVAICGVSKASGIDSFDELLKADKEVVFGATGATGPLGKLAEAVRNLTGAKMKVVYGYKGSAAVKLALTRGEVAGICGLPMSTIKSFWGDLYRSGEFKPIIQLSGKPDPELKGLPHIDSYAKSDDDKKVFNLVFGAQALGRFYFSPPGQPEARTQALREALMATMKDKDFLADAEKTKISVNPMTGEEVEQLIAKFTDVSPAVVKRAQEATKKQAK